MAKLSDELHDICRGHFSVEERVSKRTGYPADTFLDLSGWGKGLVWVNGFNLGWYWPLLGPQMTMYVPGPLLKVSGNEVVLLEFAARPQMCQVRLWLGCGRFSGCFTANTGC